ncbi:unnamed protein product [Periconia digitata]|uniref:Uncharacterized protein n=1 Tax=Periconia digitata TaxID=1303443 RepID=A0A9W4UDN9_9PLEO|nr:unnamed protein product [Periconia digitata]
MEVSPLDTKMIAPGAACSLQEDTNVPRSCITTRRRWPNRDVNPLSTMMMKNVTITIVHILSDRT